MTKVLISITITLTAILAIECAAIDRQELAKVISAFPPNGPPEHYGEIIYKSKDQQEATPVHFSHALHRMRHTCRVCHLELNFAISRRKSGMSRDNIKSGEFCGACHDGNRAFSLKNPEQSTCGSCHMKNRTILDRKFYKAKKNLPSSILGNQIDWNKAIQDEQIEPEKILMPDQHITSLPDKLKKPLELGTKAPRSGVLFSHEAHFEWLDCSNCHPNLFQIKKDGTTHFSMKHSMFGYYCGTCHMRVAFPMTDCNKCHPKMRSNAINNSF